MEHVKVPKITIYLTFEEVERGEVRIRDPINPMLIKILPLSDMVYVGAPLDIPWADEWPVMQRL